VTDEGDKKIPSQKAYRNCFCTEFNLSFFHPKKDQCVVCAASRQDSNAVHAENSIDSVFEEHIRQKNLAQDEKKQDKEASCTDDTYVISPDGRFQQTITLCKLCLQANFFYLCKDYLAYNRRGYRHIRDYFK